ncbi:MAG: sigma-54 dependent transcriptional regulator [Ignavibacterium sp.]|nr:sigma-54 dependent transcriptional regulator [Ignavibacterium sp.]MDW8376359.1 sigma-54 dependent transcriptional regulator [Ignavibacteriales bacterium]
MCKKILVIDDDEDFLVTIKKFLTEYNPDWSVDIANSSYKGENLIRTNNYDTILLDIKMEGEDGVSLLEKFKIEIPTIPIIMVSGQSSITIAIDCIQKGALDYIEKPVDKNRLVISLTKALSLRQVLQDSKDYKDIISKELEIVGVSDSIKRIKELISAIAPTDIPVLITGESGTGKEIVAKAIHQLSKRKDNKMLALNCSAIADGLIDSELFGHEKGAFTGALSNKIGFIESANNSTIFLDEIGDMKLETQAKLLRAIENKEIFRVGSTKEIKVDVRFITATNKNLKDLIRQGKFREDLYHRIKGFEINLPPLRERKEDIPLLTKHFADLYARKNNIENLTIDESVYKYLQTLDWNGNVRELKHFVENLISLSSKDKVGIVDLLKMLEFNNKSNYKINNQSINFYKEMIKNIEKEFYLSVYTRNDMNIKKTAEELGIDRSNLYRKLKEYQII